MTPKISDIEKEKRRKQIIQAAGEVFKRKGYEASSMQDIVDETGMSRGWVYIYFSSKEEIMQAIFAENDEETEIALQHFLANEPSVWKGLAGLLDMLGEQLDHPSEDLTIVIYEYFISGWRERDRRNSLEEHYSKQHETLYRYLKQGIETGEFKPRADLEVVIKMITSYFEGIQLHAKAAGSQTVRVKEHFICLKLF